MADKAFLDNVAKWSSGQKLMALFAPPLLIGILYYQFGYVTASDEYTALEAQQSDLLTQQGQLDKDLETKKKLTQRMEELQQDIRANERALPISAELPAFFDFLQRRAGEAGVTTRKWDQQTSEKVDIYVRVPVKIEVAGSFSNLVKFFFLLGPLGKDASQGGSESFGERIVSVENLTLGSAEIEDGEVTLVAGFTAATFYLDTSNPANAKAPGAANTPAGTKPPAAAQPKGQ